MKLTIIKEGGIVAKNDVAYSDLDLSALPANFHALQWDTSAGDLETKVDGRHNNENITDVSPYQWCIDAWQAAYDAEQAAIAAIAAEAAAAEAAAAEEAASA